LAEQIMTQEQALIQALHQKEEMVMKLAHEVVRSNELKDRLLDFWLTEKAEHEKTRKELAKYLQPGAGAFETKRQPIDFNPASVPTRDLPPEIRFVQDGHKPQGINLPHGNEIFCATCNLTLAQWFVNKKTCGVVPVPRSPA